MGSSNRSQAFRRATNDEIVPHRRRADSGRLPHMLYVALYADGVSVRQVGYRFIFAAQPVETPRQIIDLQVWLSQFVVPGSTLTVMSCQAVKEELV